MIDLFGWVQPVDTITADNGKEFPQHKIISPELDLDFFFAHLYAAWEHGTNENINGLIRQYLPMDRDLSALTAEEECFVMDRLNLCPRKCLDYFTPYEVFFLNPTVAFQC
jgi:IS30 family transposase